MFRNEILKLNHLLLDELFKRKKDMRELRMIEDRRMIEDHTPLWDVVEKKKM